MEREEVGRFNAVRFDREVYEFIVYDNRTMDCPALGAENAIRLVVKPRFLLFGNGMIFVNPAMPGVRDGLIKDFDINEELFEYLKGNNMISYSTDMAYLYGFRDKNGFDVADKGHPYKWAEKKGPILVKQKRGQYN